MIFCYQVAGNTMQIYTSEVFPTDARASGFGMAAGDGAAVRPPGSFPAIPWIRVPSFGFTGGVRQRSAVLLCVAAVAA